MHICKDGLHNHSLDGLHNNLDNHLDKHKDSQHVNDDMLGKGKLHFQHRQEVSIYLIVALFFKLDPYNMKCEHHFESFSPLILWKFLL